MEQKATPAAPAGKKKSADRKTIVIAIVAAVCVAAGTGYFLTRSSGKSTAKNDAHSPHREPASSAPGTHDSHGAEKHSEHSGVFTKLSAALQSAQQKVDALKLADQESQRLRLENANLRQWIEAMRFDCGAGNAREFTGNTAMKLEKETGSQVGRVLDAIQYRPPAHLLPHQLYTLGIGYLKAGEYEKSAVIFTFLTGQQNSDVYKTARDYVLTGMSWYRVEQYKLADAYFEKALKLVPSAENLKELAQARLWRALVAKRTKQESQTQAWLKDLVDHHPHSTEAAWVNPQEAEHERVPGSAHESSH